MASAALSQQLHRSVPGSHPASFCSRIHPGCHLCPQTLAATAQHEYVLQYNSSMGKMTVHYSEGICMTFNLSILHNTQAHTQHCGRVRHTRNITKSERIRLMSFVSSFTPQLSFPKYHVIHAPILSAISQQAQAAHWNPTPNKRVEGSPCLCHKHTMKAHCSHALQGHKNQPCSEQRRSCRLWPPTGGLQIC